MNHHLRAIFRDFLVAKGPWPGALLLLTMALLPMAPSAAVVTAYGALLALAWGNKFRWSTRSVPWRTAQPWMVIFFLLHVVGMVWTHDLGFGFFDLQIKSPMLLLPLLTLLVDRKHHSGRHVLLFVFTISCAFMVAASTLAAIVRILQHGGLSPAQEIFSSHWSLALHPSYFALYLSLAIATWILLPIHRWLPALASGVLLALLGLGVVLCASKIGWFLLLALLLLLLFQQRNDRMVRTALLGTSGSFAIGVAALLLFSPYAQDRVWEMFRAVDGERDPAAVTSSEVRLLTWGTAWEIFQRAPMLGTGTGDIKNELVAAYVDKGYSGAAEKQLNAHDQYLQSAACLGVAGLLALLGMVLAPFLRSVAREVLVLVFFALNALNWLVESMLEVQAGVVFFAVFAVVLGWSDHEDVEGERERTS
jgi:O-antigen ligase